MAYLQLSGLANEQAALSVKVAFRCTYQLSSPFENLQSTMSAVGKTAFGGVASLKLHSGMHPGKLAHPIRLFSLEDLICCPAGAQLRVFPLASSESQL